MHFNICKYFPVFHYFVYNKSLYYVDGGLGIPVVLVVVEGGTDCIADARKSLEHNIPVVVCAGTGRAADILAYAYTHTKTGAG